MSKLLLLTAVAYVAGIFVITCARPEGAEDDCMQPTMSVIATPHIVRVWTGVGVLCVFEGIY